MSEKGKKQILLISDHYDYGGVATTHFHLAEALKDMGYQPLLVSAFVTRTNPKIPKNMECITVRSRAWERKLMIPYIIRLAFFLRKYKDCLLLISAKDHVNLFVVLAKKLSRLNVPLICNSHTAVSAMAKYTEWKLIPKILQFCRYVYPWADYVANVSLAAAQDAETFFRLKKVYYLPNPVVDKNVPFIIKPNPFENPEAINILAAGRLTKVKNYPLMLKAFALALPKNKHLHLTILGDGEDRKALETLAKTLNISSAVTFLGFVDNAAQYMQHAACLWLTSLYEGFGIVLVEALEQGCPLLSVDCLAGPAEIIGDNEYGILVKSNEPKTHADALLALILQPKKPVEFYRKRTLEFDYHRCAENYLKLAKIL